MRVLIIEDDSGIVDSLKLLFRMRWPEVEIHYTEKGEQGLKYAESCNPDLIILDLGLPDIDGIEVLIALRLFSRIPVIITTVRNEENDIVRGLELGADDYIVKPFNHLEFLARIKAVVRRKEPQELEVNLYVGDFKLASNVRTLYIGESKIHLTHTECLIVGKLLSNINRVVSYSALANLIWGDDLVDLEALRVYISRIRQKINSIAAYANHIVSESGKGYIWKIK